KDADDDTVFRADIVSLDLASGTQTVLASSIGGAHGPSPKPDGSALAYLAASRQGQVESPLGVWLIDLVPGKGGRTPRLVSGDTDVGPAVAGDSRHGAYPTNPAWVTEDWATGEGEAALLVAAHEA